MQPESDLEFAAGEGAAVAADEEDDVVAVAPESQGAAPVDGVPAPASSGQGEFEGRELFFGEAGADGVREAFRQVPRGRILALGLEGLVFECGLSVSMGGCDGSGRPG